MDSLTHGTPAEIMQRAQKGRAGQRRLGGPWSPALDALEAFAYQDPASQNIAFADEARAQGKTSPWEQYNAVVGARGQEFTTPKVDLRSNLPAGYTANAFDEELDSFSRTGQISGQGTPGAALRGLESAGGLKPEDRTEIAHMVRNRRLPGGRII